MITYTAQQDIGLLLFQCLVYSAYTTLALWYAYRGGRKWLLTAKH